MKKIILISLLFLVTTFVFAEITADYFKPDYKFMLFNPNKLTMNHSFSFIAGLSFLQSFPKRQEGPAR